MGLAFWQISDSVFVFVGVGLALLRSTKFWYSYLRVEELAIVKDTDGSPQLICRHTKGFHVKMEKMLLLCKEHECLVTLLNIPYGSSLVSIHHSSNIVMNVMGMYITVKYYHLFVVWPVLLLAPFTSFLAIVLEYFETIFIVDSNQAYIEFLYALKAVTRKRLAYSTG